MSRKGFLDLPQPTKPLCRLLSRRFAPLACSQLRTSNLEAWGLWECCPASPRGTPLQRGGSLGLLCALATLGRQRVETSSGKGVANKPGAREGSACALPGSAQAPGSPFGLTPVDPHRGLLFPLPSALSPSHALQAPQAHEAERGGLPQRAAEDAARHQLLRGGRLRPDGEGGGREPGGLLWARSSGGGEEDTRVPWRCPGQTGGHKTCRRNTPPPPSQSSGRRILEKKVLPLQRTPDARLFFVLPQSTLLCFTLNGLFKEGEWRRPPSPAPSRAVLASGGIWALLPRARSSGRARTGPAASPQEKGGGGFPSLAALGPTCTPSPASSAPLLQPGPLALPTVDGKCRDLVRAFTRVFIAVPAGHTG